MKTSIRPSTTRRAGTRTTSTPRFASWRLAHHGKRHENPLCAMLAGCSPVCAACLDAQQRIANPTARGPQSVECFAGLCEASVPVRSGERLIGFLQTGEVIVGQPSRRQFTKTVSHLGLVANQVAIRASHAEPESVVRARQFIRDHQAEELALGDVARAVNMSTFYFCKTFKKATGLTFTDYLSRSRIETARELLGNPNARVSEVAFESGFQSLTHFNRTFRRVLGESPTEYRTALR